MILGLVNVKPLCNCTLEVAQYCKCAFYNIVFVKLFHSTQRVLFRDRDFKATSSFIVEIEETDSVIAIYPVQILRKCICIRLPNKTYYIPLPYRIHDD